MFVRIENNKSNYFSNYAVLNAENSNFANPIGVSRKDRKMEEIKRLAMDIQFFAEDDDDDLDNDELDNEEFDDEVEDEDEEESEAEDKKDDNESSTEDEKTEDDDSKKDEEEQQKKKQSREENAKYKKLREESKKIQSENEKAREQGKLEGIKLAYGGKNKFTGEDLTDEFSIKTFLTQLEMEKEGLDPVEDYAKYITEQQRKEAESVKKKKEEDAWFAKDREDFIKAYPDVELNDLIEDADFKIFSKGKVGVMPLKDIYSDYQLFVNKFNEQAKKEARKKVAKGMGGAGKVNNNGGESEYFTMEEISKYSSKELQRLKISDPKKYQKIMDSYDHNIKQ